MRLVSSLSEAISTAMWRVSLVTVAWMRCWYLPWPSCTSEQSFRRIHGMSRASAARTSDAGRRAELRGAGRGGSSSLELGLEVERRARWRDRGAARRAAGEWSRRSASSPARLPTCSSSYCRRRGTARGVPVAARLAEGDRRAGEALELDRDVLEHVAEPGALVLGQPADEAAGSPYEQPVLARGVGSAASRPSTKPGSLPLGHSSSSPRSSVRRITGNARRGWGRGRRGARESSSVGSFVARGGRAVRRRVSRSKRRRRR